MNHLIVTLPFIVFSLIIILLLAYTDPRRRKIFNKTDIKGNAAFVMRPITRKVLSWCLVLPFIPLVMMANYAGILMYCGALTVIGWLVSELPSSLI
ncbi:hypothetical protein Q4489_00445 [Thalassotalea sp. 1_MG-2023]|uniref:hypothetical protein n=1 Tax=Thalassotalea sp. 1_MG-2023 TaxID=3062680 RepID=UPI0026E2835D|nr:hypothetical protein [Thalassotalea sp. 1_MG-2023]MDO6425457.1 hypothetical protein [Thalassotalea sp. 1_MG-2023]